MTENIFETFSKVLKLKKLRCECFLNIYNIAQDLKAQLSYYSVSSGHLSQSVGHPFLNKCRLKPPVKLT